MACENNGSRVGLKLVVWPQGACSAADLIRESPGRYVARSEEVGPHLLRGDGGLLLSQDVFLNFAGCSFWQLLEEGHPVWRFEMGEIRARKLKKLPFVGLRAFVENDKSMRCFAPFFMGKTDDRHFLHGLVLQKHAFNFYRGDVFAAADNHIFYAVPNFHVAVGMHDRSVAAMKPSVAQSLRALHRIVIVPGHDHVAACDDFTLSIPIMRHIVSLLIYYA